MSKLTKIVAATLVVAATLGSIGAASAHPGYGYGHERDNRNFRDKVDRADAVRDQLAQLERRVDRNDPRDRLSPREAGALKSEIRDIREQFRVYHHNGIDAREMSQIQAHIDRLRMRLHMDSNDWNGHPG